jgi:hypothetical protein
LFLLTTKFFIAAYYGVNVDGDVGLASVGLLELLFRNRRLLSTQLESVGLPVISLAMSVVLLSFCISSFKSITSIIFESVTFTVIVPVILDVESKSGPSICSLSLFQFCQEESKAELQYPYFVDVNLFTSLPLLIFCRRNWKLIVKLKKNFWQELIA